MKYLIILLALAALPASAAERNDGPPGSCTQSLACRIASRNTGGAAGIRLLGEASLDTTARGRPVAGFDTRLPSGRTLRAVVEHVYVRLPRDRFNVIVLLDGKPHLRLNHVDLDIYAETTIEGETYLLHCFGDGVDAPDAPDSRRP